ncbi:MAG: UDP-glucose--hexose-1-phosphate uridylyltransferase [Melioribacter sp.]|nr:UDP-glucose--hexose-1-phosphate uridylyltransferase [Melioribacter sp.]
MHTNNFPHRRKNILTGEWILVSPHRTQRPWQGEIADRENQIRPSYDPECYLCPGNKRANGEVNPNYKSTFVFTNDYSALIENIPNKKVNQKNLLIAENEKGICRVVNFSPRHDLTLAEMSEGEIENVITTWQDEFRNLSSNKNINYVQIFENKGAMMGNSNPHPHCQIWAQESIPIEPQKELKQFQKYYSKNKKSLLSDYLKLELKLKERIVYENDSFAAVVPFWAVWPYETLIISKRKIANLLQLKEKEKKDFAKIISVITIKYDNLFNTSFPYSAGIHQAPTDGSRYPEWHFHMHFYPPLLRSASIKKFMVGYEMLAEPQRDFTPEASASILKNLSVKHYKSN